MKFLRALLLFCLLSGTGELSTIAHPLNLTQVKVVFGPTDQFQAEVYVDFTSAFGSSDAYYDFSKLPHDIQEKKIRELTSEVLTELQFKFGGQVVIPELIAWKLPPASRAVYNDYYVGKMTQLNLTGTIPPGRAAFSLTTLEQARLEFPVCLIIERPDRHLHEVDWIELTGDSSDLFNYDQPAAAIFKEKASLGSSALTGETMPPSIRFWYVKLGTLWRYLGLGFHHIVPDGTDHILFVLGLFFLGITWKKIISQTTVFTIAHAITLYLSTQNIFSLPSWLVEPGIALSIMFIALENIFWPKLTSFRLVVVFCFGLVHGLGFASGLKELQLPPHDFMMALLGFNFGVDFGQLFIILLAFLSVGWFRNRPWYFSRIAVPASAMIAAMGAFWAVERILFYTHIAMF